MLYAQAMEAISKLENGQEIMDAVKAEVNEKGKENKSLRDRLKAFGDRKAEAVEAVFNALEELEIDLSGDVSEQMKTLAKKEAAATEDVYSKQIKALQKSVETLQKTLADEQTEKAKLAGDNKRKTIESTLSTVFSQRVLNPGVALKYHIGNGDFDLNEDGTVVYKSKTGMLVPLTDGNIDAYLKDYPDAVKNTQNPGANSAPKDEQGGTNNNPPKLTIEQVKAMSPAEVAKNYAAVKETLAAQKATQNK